MFIGAHIMKRRGYVLSVVWGCVASGVRFPRFKLELQLHDLEKVICPFCASVFSFVNPEENDLPHRAVVKITYNMLSKQMANVTSNYLNSYFKYSIFQNGC